MGSEHKFDQFYAGWEARKYLEVRPEIKTHYDVGEIAEAMSLLFKLRGEIQKSIVEYCKTSNHYFHFPKSRPHTPDKLWSEILARHLVIPFVNDHKEITKKFKKKKILEIYPKPLAFFTRIAGVVSGGVYENNLARLSSSPITKADILTGWTTIIREFGLFVSVANVFDETTAEILEGSNISKIPAQEIRLVSEKAIPKHIFVSGNIQCPAASQVRNHFGLCIALNMGLIKAGIYSPETRISLLKEGPSNHFRKPEDMLAEYEEKINKS